MSETYYSNGKLLLTGEYAVLDGALSLAVPTAFGQSLEVTDLDTPILRWTSLDEKNQIWFQQSFELPEFRPLATGEEDPRKELSERLVSILSRARELQPDFLNSGQGAEVTTRLDFNRNWGLGTSSTLVNNIAQWARIDPYELLQKTLGGSGYDIACAIHNRPLLYRLGNGSMVKEIDFNPVFKEQLLFVYLNKKQDSRAGIAHYKRVIKDRKGLVDKVSRLTESMVHCTDLEEFLDLVEEHESLLESVLQIRRVQASLFPDYRGAIKSLGAWGGDFVLAASDTETADYFISKGYHTVIPYPEMVLRQEE